MYYEQKNKKQKTRIEYREGDTIGNESSTPSLHTPVYETKQASSIPQSSQHSLKNNLIRSSQPKQSQSNHSGSQHTKQSKASQKVVASSQLSGFKSETLFIKTKLKQKEKTCVKDTEEFEKPPWLSMLQHLSLPPFHGTLPSSFIDNCLTLYRV